MNKKSWFMICRPACVSSLELWVLSWWRLLDSEWKNIDNINAQCSMLNTEYVWCLASVWVLSIENVWSNGQRTNKGETRNRWRQYDKMTIWQYDDEKETVCVFHVDNDHFDYVPSSSFSSLCLHLDFDLSWVQLRLEAFTFYIGINREWNKERKREEKKGVPVPLFSYWEENEEVK